MATSRRYRAGGVEAARQLGEGRLDPQIGHHRGRHQLRDQRRQLVGLAAHDLGVDLAVGGAGERLGGGVGDRLGVLHLVAAGVDQRGDHPHRHVAAGAGGVAGGQHLDREAGPAGLVAQRARRSRRRRRAGGRASPPRCCRREHLPHAALVHLLPGGEEAVVLAAEVAVEGGAVEAGAVDDQLDRGLGVAALGGDLDQSLDDALALGTGGALAGLQVKH